MKMGAADLQALMMDSEVKMRCGLFISVEAAAVHLTVQDCCFFTQLAVLLLYLLSISV